MSKPDKILLQRITSLKNHLERENPLLVDVVKYFQELDSVGYQTGILKTKESFANRISWWPLVSVLGTFSAGKSTFINTYLDFNLQRTGNQAVDDKFTVMTYSDDDDIKVLPGRALDSDPRFPFYQVSEEIEKVSAGEGARIDSYLQLKVCGSKNLKGKIVIDSPGFDADEQRNTILKLTDHIINVSDLVLVFFDARHPEPGAMQDTLQHLVKETVARNDANKFVFVLNQIDTTANDDNLEEVVAAWQRGVAQAGLKGGSFYCIYNQDSAVEMADESVKARYENRSHRDLDEIQDRISKVETERAYRIVGSLESVAEQIESQWLPKIKMAVKRWRNRVLLTDIFIFILLAAGLAGLGFSQGVLKSLNPESLLALNSPEIPWMNIAAIMGLLIVIAWVHTFARKWHAKRQLKYLKKTGANIAVQNAFEKNTSWQYSIFRKQPVGWNSRAKKKLTMVREAANQFVQKLNDSFTSPSGGSSDF